MAFEESGNLITNKQTIETSFEWNTQTEWEAFQENNNIEIESGILKLATAIPGSVVAHYEFEDDSDTSTAIDSIGSNDATITGATYTAAANVGSLALNYDGSDDYVASDSAVDLVALGTTEAASVMGWINPDSATNTGGYYVLWADEATSGANINQILGVQDRGGSVRGVLRVNDSTATTTSVSVPSDAWSHVYIEVTQSDFTLIVDNGDTGSETAGHSFDITNMGALPMMSGGPLFDNYINGQVDDAAYANDVLSSSELQSIIDRAN